jgi:hypothetical protein
MPGLNVLIERGEVCHRLCAKTMFYESVIPGDDAERSGPAGPFWCARTQSLVGPDGKFAELETCRPGRACCDAP